MIKNLKLQNFRSHKASILELSPGVNIIKGTSYHGKTCIIRGLKWVLTNRPQGFAFKSYFSGNKEDTIIDLEFVEGQKVLRKRNNSDNEYIVNDISLKALRGEVPEEVLEVLQTNEINLCGQHEPYFMLQDTPGERGRKLNSVVNLEVIDEVLGKTSALIRKIKSSLDFNGQELESKEDNLLKYAKLEEYSTLADEIELLLHFQKDIAFKTGTLHEIIQQATKSATKIEEDKRWLEVKKPFEEINKLLKAKKDIDKKYESLEHLATYIDNYNSNIKGNKSWLKIKTDYDVLTLEIDQNMRLIYTIKELSLLINSITQAEKVKNLAFSVAKSKKKQRSETLKAEGICPLCGSKL